VLAGLAASVFCLSKAIAQTKEWINAIEWLWEAVRGADDLLGTIFRKLAKVKNEAGQLVNDQARADRIRRDLTTATGPKSLETKLGNWLKHYQEFVSEKPRQGETDQEFNARKERQRAQQESDWKELRNDTVDALKTIKEMGAYLEGIQSDAMSSPEWHRYKQLLNDEKQVANFLNTDMPTDPIIIDRLKEIDEELKRIVRTIDQYAGELEAATKKKPG
jgi:hypothetical protein